MKISDKDKNLLLVALGFIILVCTYFYGFQSLNDKTALLEEENLVLDNNIRRIESLRSDIDFYREKTVLLPDETKEIMDKYPSNILPADKVLYAKGLEDKYDLSIRYFEINEPLALDVSYPDMYYLDENGNESTHVVDNPKGIYLYDHNVSMTFDTGYEDIKSALKFITEDKMRKSLHEITLSYNPNSGTLSGSMNASMYQMLGNGRPYQRPEINGIRIGTDDLFKTMEDVNDSSNEE
jgi:hypothetical protein